MHKNFSHVAALLCSRETSLQSWLRFNFSRVILKLVFKCNYSAKYANDKSDEVESSFTILRFQKITQTSAISSQLCEILLVSFSHFLKPVVSSSWRQRKERPTLPLHILFFSETHMLFRPRKLCWTVKNRTENHIYSFALSLTRWLECCGFQHFWVIPATQQHTHHYVDIVNVWVYKQI